MVSNVPLEFNSHRYTPADRAGGGGGGGGGRKAGAPRKVGGSGGGFVGASVVKAKAVHTHSFISRVRLQKEGGV